MARSSLSASDRSLPSFFLSFEQVLSKKLLKSFVNGAAPLREDALNPTTFGGHFLGENDPVTTDPQPVIILKWPFEGANVATLPSQRAQCFSQHPAWLRSASPYETDDLV